jgi:transposase
VRSCTYGHGGRCRSALSREPADISPKKGAPEALDAGLFSREELEPSRKVYELALAVLILVRERRGEDLAAWRTQATQSGIEPLARFAEGLQEDLTAIQAGLTLPWSNGVTEGQVNRLKLLKRQAYGRASGCYKRANAPQLTVVD